MDGNTQHYQSYQFRFYDEGLPSLYIEVDVHPVTNYSRHSFRLFDGNTCVMPAQSYAEFVELLRLGMEKKAEMAKTPELTAEVVTPAQVAMGNI